MTNPLLELKKLGQSVWYDNIDRAQLVSGQFKRLLEEDGVVGVTANPTIFDKSIGSGHAYDEQLKTTFQERKPSSQNWKRLAFLMIRSHSSCRTRVCRSLLTPS